MYMTAARPPPAVQRRVSKRSATDRKRIHIFNKQHKTKQIQGQHTARIGKTDVFIITNMTILIKIKTFILKPPIDM